MCIDDNVAYQCLFIKEGKYEYEYDAYVVC